MYQKTSVLEEPVDLSPLLRRLFTVVEILNEPGIKVYIYYKSAIAHYQLAESLHEKYIIKQK